MGRSTTVRAACALGLVLLGCGTTTPGGLPAEPQPAPKTCQIGVVGSEPIGPRSLPLLDVGGIRPITITGELASVVLQLVGTEVELCGAIEGPDKLRAMQVETVQLRSVGGQAAHLGRIVARGGGTWSLIVVPTGREIALDNVPARIQATASDRWIWVSGRWRDDRFAVVSFGVVTLP